MAKIIEEGLISWAPLRAAGIDGEAQELTRCLLVREPAIRLDAGEALRMPWLMAATELRPHSCVQDAGGEELLHRLTSFKDLPKFSKVALMMAGQQVAFPDVDDTRKAFLALDRSADGTLSREDLARGFALYGFPLGEGQLDAIFDSLDVDGDRRVSWAEWLSAAHAPDSLFCPAVVGELFRFFDAGGNQKISQQDLRLVVGDVEAQRVLKKSGSPSGHLHLQHFQMLAAQIARHQYEAAPRASRARSSRASSWSPSCAGRTVCRDQPALRRTQTAGREAPLSARLRA